jgi:outer membrane beta-barrel protein
MKRSTYSPTFESLLRRYAAAVATAMVLTAGPAFAQTAPGDAPPPGDSTATVDAPQVDDSATPVPAVSDSSAGAATRTSMQALSNPRMTGVRKVRLIGGERNVVRSGPGDTYSISGVYPGGAEFPVIAKSGAWYNIRLSDTETAWIHASLCREFDDLSDLQFRPNPKMYSRTGSFILAGNAGGYSFDRKSNSLVLGGRFGYYVFDRLQVEGGVSWTHVHRPAEIVETLFGLTLEAEDFDMLFYHLISTWELLPGRQMVPFVSAGVGSAIMQGESEPSFNFGAGTTLYLSKRTAMRWEVRDYRFTSGSTNSRRTNNNIEFTLGSLLLF